MKLLFLDIDGVLVVGTENWGTPTFKKEAIDNLSYIWRQTECKIVISSTWRFHPHLIMHLLNRLTYINPTMEEDFIGFTPDIALLERDKEIFQYLNSIAKARLLLHQKDFVEKYVVIDDAPEFFIGGNIHPNHLHFVDRNVGLTNKDTFKIIKYLNGE